jgi:hypothetical protein
VGSDWCHRFVDFPAAAVTEIGARRSKILIRPLGPRVTTYCEVAFDFGKTGSAAGIWPAWLRAGKTSSIQFGNNPGLQLLIRQ